MLRWSELETLVAAGIKLTSWFVGLPLCSLAHREKQHKQLVGLSSSQLFTSSHFLEVKCCSSFHPCGRRDETDAAHLKRQSAVRAPSGVSTTPWNAEIYDSLQQSRFLRRIDGRRWFRTTALCGEKRLFFSNCFKSVKKWNRFFWNLDFPQTFSGNKNSRVVWQAEPTEVVKVRPNVIDRTKCCTENSVPQSMQPLMVRGTAPRRPPLHTMWQSHTEVLESGSSSLRPAGRPAAHSTSSGKWLYWDREFNWSAGSCQGDRSGKNTLHVFLFGDVNHL